MTKSTKILFLTTSCHGVNHMFWEAIGPLMPFLIMAYDLNYTQAGQLGLIFTFVYGLMNYPSGHLSDRFGKRIFLMLFLLLSSLSFLLIIFATSFWQLFVIFALAGFSGGLYHPPGTAMLSNAFSVKMRGRSLGLHASGASLGILVAYVVVSGFSKYSDWRYSVICMSAIGFLLLAYFLLFLWKELAEENEQQQPEQNSENIGNGPSLGFFALMKVIPRLLIIYGLVMFLFKGAYVWVPTYLKDAYALDVGSAVSLTIILPVMGLFSNYIMGSLSDKIGRKTSLIIVFAMLVLCLFLMYAGFKQILIPLLIVFGFFINCFSGIINALTRDMLPADMMGRAFGIIFTFSICLSSLSPYIMGIISDKFSLSVSMLFLSGIAFVGLFITIMIPSTPNAEKTQK